MKKKNLISRFFERLKGKKDPSPMGLWDLSDGKDPMLMGTLYDAPSPDVFDRERDNTGRRDLEYPDNYCEENVTLKPEINHMDETLIQCSQCKQFFPGSLGVCPYCGKKVNF